MSVGGYCSNPGHTFCVIRVICGGPCTGFSYLYFKAHYMKTRLFLAALLISTGLFAQNSNQPKPKLSAGAQLYFWQQEQLHGAAPQTLPEYVYHQDASGNVYLSTFVKVAPGFSDAAIKALGAKIGTKAGNVWTVRVPLAKMPEFAQISGIDYIDTDVPSAPSLDTARKYTKVDSVHQGYWLPQAYSGNGVVVGIVDAGFDYTHPTFFDTSYTHYRIKRVWEEKNTSGTPPAAYGYGTEFSDSASIMTKAYDIYTGTHGTHVAGIAGGSGAGGPGGDNKPLRGMSYASDLVFVAMYPTPAYWLNTGMADMLDGINYVFDYAGSVSKPAVTNLSWGCPLGPHDGSSLFSQACDAITGNGRIFVLSAGNNGTDKIHLKKTFTASGNTVSTVCTFPTGLTEKRNWVDVWGDTSKTFCMKFYLYSGSTKVDSSAQVCLDNAVHQYYLKGLGGDTCFITVSTVASEFNMKPHMLVQMYTRTGEKVLIKATATDGSIDMWQGYVLNTSGYYGMFIPSGIPGAVTGDVNSTISDMVTSASAISVGAYNSKPTFTNVSGSTLTYTGYTKGNIASFSSHGPTADGRTRPDITGPGLAVASSINHVDSTFLPSGTNYGSVVSEYTSPLNGNVYRYAMEAGTSMSGPCVSGIVGLLLEANGGLDPYQVKSVLATTAIVDSHTGAIPVNGSNTWGYGKVNAYRAMIHVLGLVGITHEETSPLTLLVYPNPNTGSYSIDYTGEQNELLTITVTDLAGKQIKSEKWSVKPGSNKTGFDLGHAPAGIYFTTVTGVKGQHTVKIVKQ